MYAEATFAWSLPATSAGGVRYAGVFLYLVNVTGTAPLSTFPQALTAMQSNVDTALVLDIPNNLGAVIPTNPEVWTIAAISADINGVLADDPSKIRAVELPFADSDLDGRTSCSWQSWQRPGVRAIRDAGLRSGRGRYAVALLGRSGHGELQRRSVDESDRQPVRRRAGCHGGRRRHH